MNSKITLSGVLILFTALALCGSAIAATDEGSEAGQWSFSFNQPATMADEAARGHQYDPEALARVGTEQGLGDYRFTTPVADKAAKLHAYDPTRLSQVGSEAGVRDVASGVLCSRC